MAIEQVLGLIFAASGAFFILVGVFFLAQNVMKMRKEQFVLENGKYVKKRVKKNLTVLIIATVLSIVLGGAMAGLSFLFLTA